MVTVSLVPVLSALLSLPKNTCYYDCHTISVKYTEK